MVARFSTSCTGDDAVEDRSRSQEWRRVTPRGGHSRCRSIRFTKLRRSLAFPLSRSSAADKAARCEVRRGDAKAYRSNLAPSLRDVANQLSALNITVDVGEAEAIALAHERRCRIILDDRKARTVAVRLGVPVTGTVGLLLKAKQVGVISAILPLLDALDDHFHVSRALCVEALRFAGE